jgi:hypothetical protein
VHTYRVAMTDKSLVRMVVMAAVLLAFGPASAGVVPLAAKDKKVGLASGTALTAERDLITYRILADRIQVTQHLVLSSADRPGKFMLGLPLGAKKHLGPQKVLVGTTICGKTSKQKLSRKKAHGLSGVSEFLTFRIKLAAGQQAEVRVSWWQPHEEIDVNGYWRYALIDPLWTAGSYRGQVGQIERRLELSAGIRFVSAEPDPKALGSDQDPWERRDRLLSLAGKSPAADARFVLKYKRKTGALSNCEGSDAWLAADGDRDTVFKPQPCGSGQAWIDLISDCSGFGTGEAKCERVLKPAWVAGLSAWTPDGKNRQPLMVEGYWGPDRIWKKSGRLNAPVPVRQAKRVTRYRLRFPKGLPKGGINRVGLLRLLSADSEAVPRAARGSDPGAKRALSGKGFGKLGPGCMMVFSLQNAVSFDHLTLKLNPRSKVDTYLFNMDCTDGRKREPYHEPAPCNHTPEQHRKLGLDPATAGLGQHEGHFKREHPHKVELDLDPNCVATKFRVLAPPMLCDKRFRPPVPQVWLTY